VATDREKTLQSAQKYVDKRRYDKAIEEYQKIIREDPEDARTLLKIGDLQSRMQAYAEAIATYDRVGQYYAAKGFALKAIAVYKQIRELIRKHAPQLADRYAHIVPKLAEIYTQLGLTSDALSAYDEVATRLQKTGRDREAINIFLKMVELDMANPLPHLRLAEACCRVQDLDRAIESFWAAAELLLGLERRDDALKVIERILHFRQDPRFARVAAELYLQRSTREAGLQAIAKLQISFQADPKDLDTLALLAQAFSVIGDDAKALEVHKEMARIARDQGNQRLFEELMQHLTAAAPEDEGVRALESGFPPARRGSAASLASATNLSDADLVSVSQHAAQGIRRAATEPPGAAAVRRTAPPPSPPARKRVSSAPEVLTADDDLDGVEELGAAQAFDAAEHARKAVADAESFRRLRLYSKAIEVLQLALEVDPRSVEIRDKLCQLLQESGDIEGAVNETITLAALYIDLGAPEHGQTLLYEVLQLAPNHPTALRMLEQICGGVPAQESPYYQPDVPPQPAWQSALDYDVGVASGEPGYGHDAPLPSFGLDEPLGAEAAGVPAYQSPEADSLDVDDPFTEVAARPYHGPAAQAIPNQDAAAEYAPGGYEGVAAQAFDEGFQPTGPAGETAYALDDEAATQMVFPPQDLARPSSEAPPADQWVEAPLPEPSAEMAASDVSSEAIEEVLDEAEFFSSRGLYEDAKAILEDQLARTPNHPLLLEQLKEIEQAQATPGESGTIQRSQLAALATAGTVDEDRAFDIAASLEALDELEDVAPGPGGRGGFASAHDEVNVDQVFAKFKAGIRAQVSETDAATHYDLGVAYREMGLVVDAINEFELAAHDPERECMCHAMVGMIHLEQGDLEKAAAAYVRGLEASKKSIDQEMNLYYDLGNVKEMMGNAEEALYYFNKIARRDPGFRDVQDRIAALSSEAEVPKRKGDVAGEDEFDAVFDELFESK
jgi:tetratricopeptide (TPR) repeat protein